MWNEDGSLLYRWSATNRVQDLAISPDGQRLITISPDNEIFVYRLQSRVVEYSHTLEFALTSINVSQDSKCILVNLAQGELHLYDLDSGNLVQRFYGQKQGNFIIKSTFGGSDENLVITGSEGMAFCLQTQQI